MSADLEAASGAGLSVLDDRRPQPDAAARLDEWLRKLARQDARCRLVLGELAAVFLRRGCSRRLGFARLGDFTRERIGISPRELEEAARVARRLRELPELRAAFEAGELCWSQVREILAVATADDESTWISTARGRPVREVKRLVTEARRSAGGPVEEDDEDHIEGESRATFRIPCPRRIRVLWRRGVELARAMAGEECPVWKAAETIAAEATSAAECDGDDLEPGVTRERTIAASPAADLDEAPSGWETLDAAIPADIEALVSQCESRDTFELDRRMIRCVREMQRTDWQIGRCLRVLASARLHRRLGFRSVGEYVRERLGLSSRKARALIALDRAGEGGPVGEAYRRGGISWVRASAILPLAAGDAGRAWVMRAQEVPVRRLLDEVAWALDWQDSMNPPGGKQPVLPPPLNSRLELPEWQTCATPETGSGVGSDRTESGENGEWQTCAVSLAAPGVGSHGAESPGDAERQTCARLAVVDAEPLDAEVAFSAPASVVSMFRSIVRSFYRPGELEWRGLERVLLHVIREWESQPDHPNPTFRRAGHRCEAPICTSRKNLHSHHAVWRSHGGGDEPENLVCTCLFHHGGIHQSYYGIPCPLLRVSGRAPDELVWEIGLKPLHPPLLRFRGEAYATD